MRKYHKIYLYSILWLLLTAFPAHALTSITVMADSSMSVAMAEIARDYSRDKQIVVNTSFAPPRTDEAQIIAGADADILITPKQGWIDRLKERGLVDIYSIMKVAKKSDVGYIAVVIAGDNMDEARKFIEYLKSPDAKKVFQDSGFNVD